MAMDAPEVYDVVYPSPIPLTKLSSIAVAIQLWHLDLNQYLKNGNLSEEFYASSKAVPRITLQDIDIDIDPILSSVIHRMTEKYLKMLVSSTSDWLVYHFDRIFSFHRDNHNLILNDFNDIVCDYDGTIDYVRTAKKMMLCDRISPDEKFKIACSYSFEEYIKQIGPFVQSKVNLNAVNFNLCSHLYYWTCYLRNEMDKIPNERNIPIDDLMLEKTPPEARSSFEYFWNRASAESRHEKAVKFCMTDGLSFCGRFILPKFNELQLTAFLNQKSSDLVYFLFLSSRHKEHAFPVWMFIKDRMDQGNFTSLIERFLWFESHCSTINRISIEELNDYRNEYLQTGCEIWDSAPEFRKEIVLEGILRLKILFKVETQALTRRRLRETRLLQKILSESTLQERTAFWLENWSHLICSTRVSDLDQIMNLCFNNKTEIDTFKRNTMGKYAHLIGIVSSLMGRGLFKELTDVLNFCVPDPHISADLKRQCLRSTLFYEDFTWGCGTGILCEFQSLHDFINDASAHSPEFASDFRNEFISSAVVEKLLSRCIQGGNFARVKLFVQSFELFGQNLDKVKIRLVEALKQYLNEGCIRSINAEHMQDFLLWCLGSDDCVFEFKQSISPDNVLSNILGLKACGVDMREQLEILDQFLLWYFATPQEMDEFKTKHAQVFNKL